MWWEHLHLLQWMDIAVLAIFIHFLFSYPYPIDAAVLFTLMLITH
ncbi:putative membrane protein [Vibrio paracholerae 87395]|nr:putative membrane protein [Vibrio paracholerae HE-09]EMP93309.1 putative membrane protein [Vibrio paracholerae 87395]